MEEIIKKGEVITVLHDNGCKSILVMESENWFSYALNWRGRKDEEDRIWYEDGCNLDDYKWRWANLDEIKTMTLALLSEEQVAEVKVDKKETCILVKVVRLVDVSFCDYIRAVIDFYNKNKSLRGFSKLRDKYKVGGITIEQFFQNGLNKVKEPWGLSEEFFAKLKNNIKK